MVVPIPQGLPSTLLGSVALTVIMCTRDRGARLLPGVASVLSSRSSPDELIVVDQSATNETENALRSGGVLVDPRLVYLRTSTRGLSRGRNLGLARARGSVIAFTDDDCVVGVGWAQKILERFDSCPTLGVFFGPVLAAVDTTTTWTPIFAPAEEGFVSQSRNLIRHLGIGANFAVRRSIFDTVGEFDEFLGAGEIGASEDTDLAYRALRAGFRVAVGVQPTVTHEGVRHGDERKATGRLYLRGMAAMCAKHVRCGDTAMAWPLIDELGRLIARGTLRILRGKSPSGYGAAITLLAGTASSTKYPIDGRTRVYRARAYRATTFNGGDI